MAYSIDLRERVLAFYDDGNSQQETIATFRIRQSALNSWLRLRKETGNLEKKPVSNFPSKYESAKLRQYIEEHPFALLKEIAAYFGGSISGACDALKREKITLKKRQQLTKKETKKNGEYLMSN